MSFKSFVTAIKSWQIVFATPLFLLVLDAHSAENRQVFQNPPLLQLVKKDKPLLAGTDQIPKASHEKFLDLNITYTRGKIWNPAVQRYDQVNLRSYQGTDVNPDAPYISPMIDVSPGDTVRIHLHNKLPPEESCTKKVGDINVPHCFNGTNLHAHGLWVSPAGNSDNVLLRINPGVSFEYEYNIPLDHPAGTFWYHTHSHGSTALQVGSGMAGALIIRGNRLPTPTARGDIDTLLSASPTQSFKERILVMQQIQYACRDKDGKIKLNKDKTYQCDENDIGGVEGYDQFGPSSWPASGRYTSINGLILPNFFDARAGQIERWRIIHAGVRDTINLQFRKVESKAIPSLSISAAENDAFIEEYCTGEPLPQHLIAADGLTMGQIMVNDETVFQPGYRWDALMAFPQAGIYCVIDTATPPSASVNQTAPSRQLLGVVHVGTGRDIPANQLTQYVVNELIGAAGKMDVPVSVRDRIASDLRNDRKLSAFIPHPDIQDSELTGTQELVFNIDTGKNPIQFQVNGKPFAADRVDRILMLGGVDEWTLRSDFVSHPFHIHVNPFQIVKILDPEGKDVSGPDAVDDKGGLDVGYRGLKGVWKDTLWVKNLNQGKAGQYTLIVRTRYQRYIGDYVLHCHILDHEDQGMMQIVRVALPDGSGGVSQGHHH